MAKHTLALSLFVVFFNSPGLAQADSVPDSESARANAVAGLSAQKTRFARVSDEHLANLRASMPACRPTRSVGLPWRGRLRCGVLPEPHPRVLVQSEVVFATRETQRLLRRVATRLAQRDPQGPPIELFDISGPAGGQIPYHLSHQTGRDIDLGYVLANGSTPGVMLDLVTDDIDVERNWILIEELLETGQVQVIFVDWKHQAALYEVARAAGFAKLGKTFQYPRPASRRVGILRHLTNHHGHMHVRLKCPDGHPGCRG